LIKEKFLTEKKGLRRVLLGHLGHRLN